MNKKFYTYVNGLGRPKELEVFFNEDWSEIISISIWDLRTGELTGWNDNMTKEQLKDFLENYGVTP